MKFINRLLPALIGTVLLTVPAFAQVGNIGGKVVDVDGKPLVGATVAFDAKGVTHHEEVKTGKDGAYFKSGLPAGMYKVTLIKDGTPVTSADNQKVPFGSTATVDIDLRKAAAAGPSAEEKAKADADKKAADEEKNAFNAGMDALHAKDYPQAITLLKQVADKDPTQHVVFANLGEAYSGARKYPEAITAYSKAVELKPDEFGYYNNLGIAYGNAGQIDDAIKTLQKAGEINPTLAPTAYFNLGALLTNKGKSADAAAAFKKAIDLKPDYAQAYLQLGIALFGSPATMGDAIPVLQKFLTLNPSPTDKDTATQLLAAAQQAAPAGYKAPKADNSNSKTTGKTPSPLQN